MPTDCKLILTDKHIKVYICNDTVEESQKLEDITYIVRSTANLQEILICFLDETCMRFEITSDEEIDYFFVQIVLCFDKAVNSIRRLRLYNVPDNKLNIYMTFPMEFDGKRS